MVFALKLRSRRWHAILISFGLLGVAHGATLDEAKDLYEKGQYFTAARYAFSTAQEDRQLRPQAYAWITMSLVRARLYQSASYFFIRTLQSGHKPSIQRVLVDTQDLMIRLGPDFLRHYLQRHTQLDDYQPTNRSVYLFSLGKDALLKGFEQKALEYLSGVSSSSKLYAYSLQLKGTANAILGKTQESIRDFKGCQEAAVESDLKYRCIAAEARALYQMNDFDEADWVWDQVPKHSIVWPDLLFEQAWNAFARGEYNRALGRLVSYKSPALGFVFNTEVDVLRAQSFLALCLYNDTNDVINEFNSRYQKVGEDVKRFVESKGDDLPAFFEAGRYAYKEGFSTKSEFNRFLNRFIRVPHFKNLLDSDNAVSGERLMVREFDARQGTIRTGMSKGFPAFLDLVLRWRARAVRNLGGAFVKNSLIDHHQILLQDFEKISFIKLELLSRAKDKLIFKKDRTVDRGRGNVTPKRRDDQFYWGFNGEFWNDELGDYVFGLETECGK